MPRNNKDMNTEPGVIPPGEGLENFDLLNNQRAEFGLHAIVGFVKNCATDDCDAVADMLCDVMHLLDRMPERYGTWEQNLSRAQGHYQAEIGPREAQCQNCDWVGAKEALGEIVGLHMRVSAGEPMPAGECPACGALAHLINDQDDTPGGIIAL